jgi:hopene-associated glycosyltransferase HpnB
VRPLTNAYSGDSNFRRTFMPISSSIFIGLAAFSLLLWITLTFFWGAFWQLRAFADDASVPHALPVWPRVAAIVPARNEAETIARTVDSLLKQDYAGEFQVLVVDDHSEDNTADLARDAAQATCARDRVVLLRAAGLPSGWTGKIWAMQQGVERATQWAPEYLWFTDADIVHAPDTLKRLVSRVERRKLDLASLMVLLQAKSVPERLLIPPFFYFFLMLYPPKWIADPDARTAGAAGGCVLLRRTALERLGGFASLCAEVIDDCALARAVKRSGGMIWMGLTRKSVSLRSYKNFNEIRDLIARTAFTQLEYSGLQLLGTLLGMFLAYLVPPLLAFHLQPLVWRLSLTAWALMTISYLPTVRYFGLSPLWAPLLPVAATFYCYATSLSAVRYWLGHGGQWKGRSQAPKS